MGDRERWYLCFPCDKDGQQRGVPRMYRASFFKLDDAAAAARLRASEEDGDEYVKVYEMYNVYPNDVTAQFSEHSRGDVFAITYGTTSARPVRP